MKLFKKSMFLIALGLCFFVQPLLAQQSADPVLVTIGNKSYGKQELMDLYVKNNFSKVSKIDKKDFEEYVQLFINYKLKIKEAEALKIDTLPSFVSEYGSYRDDLKAPYLRDDSVMQAYAKQAYDRTLSAVRASHILAKSEYGSSAKDTLAAYKKIYDVYKRLEKGENFAKLAEELSDDLTARDTKDPRTQQTFYGNKGDLGYFSGFDILYPVEDACYTMKVNQYSKPVHSHLGYHIVLLTNKLPMPGESMDIQHIWTGGTTSNDSLKAIETIKKAYKELQAGADFTTVAKKYSSIDGVEQDGGFLYSQTPAQLLPDYFERLVTMKEGDYTQPFKTQYGWHILKFVSAKEPRSYEIMKDQMMFKVSRDERNIVVINNFLNKVKKEQGFKENRKELEAMRKYFNNSIFANNWKVEEGAVLNKELFNFNKTSYTQQDFANFIIKGQTIEKKPVDIDFLYNSLYDDFVKEVCMNWADTSLASRNKDFAETLENYREGLLIFAINDRNVWSKAILDSVGLQKFYEQTKSSHLSNQNIDENYFMWNERADVTEWELLNNCLTQDQVSKILITSQKKAWNNEQTLAELKKKAGKKANGNIGYTVGLYEAKDRTDLGKETWKINSIIIKDSSTIHADNTVEKPTKFNVLVVHNILPPSLKLLDEARGYYISEYQNYLEKEWNNNLRKKYTFSINQAVLDTIK